MKPSTHESLRGVLLGTAIGDALGLPAEGLSARRAARWWKGKWRMRFAFGCGMVSDDTEHTYAVAEALSTTGGDVARFQRVLAKKLRWWFLALPAGVGMATARACIKLWLGFPPGQSGVFSAGNGPAMRIALIGVFFRDNQTKRREFVRANTRLTHTDPKAETAALAIAEAAACGSMNGSRDALLETMLCLSDDPEWRTKLSLFRECALAGKTTREFAAAIGLQDGVSGYAFHTVPVALYAWMRHHEDFEKALTSALDCGGDTDTVGAIVGALAGASLGGDAIPKVWEDALQDWPISRARLESAASALASAQPVACIFWPARLLRNVVFLAIVLTHGFRRLFPPY
jgi:ADP-ribosyl-[dinitrogen reductase] hydrolase